MNSDGFYLYLNRIYVEIKEKFELQFDQDVPVQIITENLIAEYQDNVDHIDEAPFFWISLAESQWEFGVLLPLVKEKALWEIDKLNKWNEQSLLGERSVALHEYLYQLKSKLFVYPNSPYQTPSKGRYKCPWNLGDVFAYRLESDLAKERGFYGRYFLVQKVDECVWYPDHIVPIVYVKMTEAENLPLTLEQYNKLEYVQVWFTRYEDRFLPIDMSCPEKDIADKSKLTYQVDEWGFLPQYRIILCNTAFKSIPKNLKYVGNFVEAQRPLKEFIPHSCSNIVSVSWKGRNESFETKLIKRYCGHNLRELSIYTNSHSLSDGG